MADLELTGGDLLRDRVGPDAGVVALWPYEAQALADLMDAVHTYTGNRGWAVIGDDDRCVVCLAHMWIDPDHAEGCSYDRMVKTLDAVFDGFRR